MPDWLGRPTAADAVPEQAPQGPGSALVVVAGPHAGEVHPLTWDNHAPDGWVIGRSSAVAVPLTRDRFVSREHACVREEPETWTVHDLQGRRNPSRLDGIPLVPDVAVPLPDGALFECGRSVLVLRTI